MLKEASSHDTLVKELAEKKMYTVNYRIVRDGKIKYYQMKVVRAGTWEKNHGIVLGFHSVDEETRTQMEQKNLL
ncbi:hypothetical protein, partial [Streptomyces galilaeus]|uniref:hypothetical protein n=1 Tax=Streptomyces galilaeus TaxID=33899 RepID=UPI0038F60747